MYVIKSLGLATGRPMNNGELLRSWDPDGNSGRGSFFWTDDASKAMVFLTKAEAFEEWKTQGTLVPIRPDGKPNRPLTAFSVEVLPLVEVLEVRDGHE